MPDTVVPPTTDPQAFLDRWRASGAAEQANSQLFLGELCDLLGVPRPEPTRQDDAANAYVFEKVVEINNGDGTQALGRIDLYRKGAFVLESKQGSERKRAEDDEALSKVVRGGRQKTGTAPRGTKAWDQAMTRARNQAKRYAEALPEEWPPLLIVCDVGYCLDVYADFARTGKNYAPFPDPQSFRIRLDELADPAIRERLKLAWLDPLALDPARRSAKVTRELAAKLAELAKRLERRVGGGGNGGSGEARDDVPVPRSPASPDPPSPLHTPDAVAQFLMRCLFTVFAEDVGLIPKHGFHDLLVSLRDTPEDFAPMVESLWATMDTGGFSPILRQKLLRFNGGLFEDRSALPLDHDQLELLIEASEADWSEVEPAIFGTLLERALDPRERHKLGAHYTPRAYVERLVVPTVMEPLRAEWDDVYAAAVQLDADGNTKQAKALVRAFHGRLCEVRILDPACGSGNFLYVSLELIKRLEGEVLNALKEFGDNAPPLLTVDPHQFLGIEINPRAAAIADLVLWIGYLQWHFRTRGKTTPPEPVLHAFHNIENRDAVLAYDGTEPVLDENGTPVTHWDGRTTKPHPVTGEEVPDETARVPVLRYLNPRKAEWPQADYVVGNPPFLGNKRMRTALGDGYVEALRKAHPVVPESADLVMFWWDKAAQSVRMGRLRRFGLVTTNSITQSFNRQIVASHLTPNDGTALHLDFAIPNHPWIEATDGADVRIAMTVATSCDGLGRTARVIDERPSMHDDSPEVVLAMQSGRINADLSIGADTTTCVTLQSNRDVSSRGVIPHGAGFVLSDNEAAIFGFGSNSTLTNVIKPYLNNRDLMGTSRRALVIDLYGLSEQEVRDTYPALYQHLLTTVKPERDQNRDRSRRERWWLFARSNEQLRRSLAELSCYIVTGQTSKHRIFTFLDASYLPDDKLIAIALNEAFFLGVLSSRIHVVWSLASGSRLGVGNDPVYDKTRCFEPFPFPTCTEAQQTRIRELAEALDAHRKRQQAAHPGLTMTGMYNVLEKLREIDRRAAERGEGEAPAEPHGPCAIPHKLVDVAGLQNETSHTASNASIGSAGASPSRKIGSPSRKIGSAGASPSRKVGSASRKASSPATLTAKEKAIHEQGLVSVLRQLHDDLDAAVADAYGWPVDLTDEQILERLVALNKERAAEEAKGLVRWLRPAFQNPGGTTATQKTLTPDETPETTPVKPAKIKKRPWPSPLPERVQAVRSVLHEGRPLSAYELSRRFTRAKTDTVTELLDTLVTLGQARQLDDGRYAA